MFPEGKILKVNLSERKIEKEVLPANIYRLYPGGSALGLYLISRDMNPKVDALSPENNLIFSVSPLTGLPISGLSRVTVTTKSPLTDAIGDSQAGGFFPVSLKGNGWDSIQIIGRADSPCYLFIDGDKVEIKDASDLWGKVTGETEKFIKKTLGREDLDICEIGPGGENQVKYASIMNMCNRANGRNGTGAVMGSKNLKAIVLVKTKGRRPKNIGKFTELTKNFQKRLAANEGVAGLGKYGTSGDTLTFSDNGWLPTRNWQRGHFPEGAKNIDGGTMYETVLKERDTCFACGVRCKRVVEIEGKVDPLYGGPEYETVGTMGSYCGITSLETVCIANQLCNMHGLDTISCGATISFAMECFENGLLTLEDTGGIDLSFGNDEALIKVIELIAKGEGIGKLLALGSARAAEVIGGNAREYVMAIKKQEMPAHMPQWKPGMGIVYAVNPFGADHQSSEHDPFIVMPEDSEIRKRLAKVGFNKDYEDQFQLDDDKVRFAFDTQCFFSITDTLNLCQFVWGPAWELYGPEELVKLCKFGLGWDTSLFELMRIGERRINMMRQFNAVNGFTKADDKLPKRLFKSFIGGPEDGIKLDEEEFTRALERYYEIAGWDSESGNPTKGTLRKLSLEWMIDLGEEKDQKVMN